MAKIKSREKLIIAIATSIIIIALVLFLVTRSRKDNEVSKSSDGPSIVPTEIIVPTETVVPTIETNIEVIPTIAPTSPPTVVPTLITNVINCSDCFLAAVDKYNSLPSNYAPSVVNTGLSGGGSVTAETKVALSNMFEEASKAGISMEIISSYRSYAQQQSTFEYWVNKEIAAGYNRAQAEGRANQYSARAGHSEHQLGTTVDLKCSGCGSFDNSANNMEVYNFLENNAHKFGFVISYPKDSEYVTGYVYEPWHIRYIGLENAQKLFNTGYVTGNGNYLSKFLSEL